MTGSVKVSIDPSTNGYCVVVHGVLSGSGNFDVVTPTLGSRFFNELNATGNGDGTITVLNVTNNTNELFNVPFALFLDEDENQLGITEASTVNELNGIFSRTGSGIPSITSSNAIFAGVTGSINYTITATNSPTIFVESGLPFGLLLDPSTGIIVGTAPSEGVYNFNVAAGNSFGSDTLAISLTVTGSYENTLSTDFIGTNSNFAQFSGSAAVPSPSSAWSKSLWFHSENRDGILGFVGDRLSDEGWSLKLLRSPRRIFVVGGDVTGNNDDEGGTPSVAWMSSGNIWSQGDWNHLAITYDGTLPLTSSGLAIYLNNADITTASGSITEIGSFSSASWSGENDVFRLGSGPDSDPLYASSNIDEVSLWNAELSSAQISEIRSGSTPADLTQHSLFSTNCIGWWRMGDGDTFPTIRDLRTGSHDLTMFNMTSAAFQTDVPS